MIVSLDPVFSELALSRGLELYQTEDILSTSTHFAEKAEGLVVRLGTLVNEITLRAFKNLKWVATITTGTDHIDENYLKKKDVGLISLKGEVAFLTSIHATPEHTWALLLALLRKIPHAHTSVCQGYWERKAFEGNELFHKTLGIIGYGRVGKIVGEYGKAFGMKILTTDINPMDGSHVDLETLLRTSDVISLHVPLNSTTENLLGDREFGWMKTSAVLINTSRGLVVNESALLKALEGKKIAGAALDVLASENTGGIHDNNPLILYARNHENLILTPHIAGSTQESLKETAGFILNKILTQKY